MSRNLTTVLLSIMCLFTVFYTLFHTWQMEERYQTMERRNEKWIKLQDKNNQAWIELINEQNKGWIKQIEEQRKEWTDLFKK